jgi:effector-binding domain-containing protein
MREFYLTDPSIEKDEAKWQTRIMVPVVQAK